MEKKNRSIFIAAAEAPAVPGEAWASPSPADFGASFADFGDAGGGGGGGAEGGASQDQAVEAGGVTRVGGWGGGHPLMGGGGVNLVVKMSMWFGWFSGWGSEFSATRTETFGRGAEDSVFNLWLQHV